MGSFIFRNGRLGHCGSDPVPRSLPKENEEGDGEGRGTDMTVGKRNVFSVMTRFFDKYWGYGFQLKQSIRFERDGVQTLPSSPV